MKEICAEKKNLEFDVKVIFLKYKPDKIIKI
jgi:hypothetical protein